MKRKLKLVLCLSLVGIWNAFGTANCSSSSYMAPDLRLVVGGACTQQAALDAINCFQNTCLQSKM